jgi:hypothetical protein
MLKPRSRHSALHHFLVFAFCYPLICPLLLTGCNRNAGPPRFGLTGKITCAGKPVPAGYILFVPDKSKGNDGPGASAEIKDGVYKIRPNEGVIGGPHTAKVSGFDGKPVQQGPVLNPMGSTLFLNAPVDIELPKEDASYDIVVPVTAKK